MLDPKLQAEIDQASAVLAEIMPTLWENMFTELRANGFTVDQSMDVLCTYIASQGSAPVIIRAWK